MKLNSLFVNDYHGVRESKLTLFDQYFFRPLGIVFVYLIWRFYKISPNDITFISVIMTLIGSVLLIFQLDLLAYIFLICFPILDCADGTLARYLESQGKSNKAGNLVDAIGGYTFIMVFWSTLQYRFADELYLSICCNFICVIGIFCRLYFNKKALVSLTSLNLQPSLSRSSRLYYIYENIEFGSALLPLFGLALLFNGLVYFVILYSLASVALLLWCILDFIRFLRI